jgi:hypothetical protein
MKPEQKAIIREKTVPVQKPESDPFFEKVAQKIADMFQHLTFDSESRYCIDYIMQGSEQDVETILREAFSEFSNLWQRIIVEQTRRADENEAWALRAEAEIAELRTAMEGV